MYIEIVGGVGGFWEFSVFHLYGWWTRPYRMARNVHWDCWWGGRVLGIFGFPSIWLMNPPLQDGQKCTLRLLVGWGRVLGIFGFPSIWLV